MKTPLVLLPGLLSNETIWEHQIACLSNVADIQVITSAQDTPEKMIRAILDKAPQTFALAGHSMGGWLCLEVMKAAPSRVSRLCLLNTTSRPDPEEKRNNRKKMIADVRNGKFSEVVKRVAEIFVNHPEHIEAMEKMFVEVGPETFINQEQAMLRREESQSVLRNIPCPTLVIHAADDRVFTLEEHEEMADQIPHAQLAIIDDSGHMSPVEAPEAITLLMRSWLLDVDCV